MGDRTTPRRPLTASDLYAPLIFAPYPALYLYQTNSGMFIGNTIGYPILVVVLAALACWGLWTLLLRDDKRAGLVTIFWTLWIFAYGHLNALCERWAQIMRADDFHFTLLAIWCGVWVVGTVVLIKAIRRVTPTAALACNLISLLLVLPLLGQLGWQQLRHGTQAPSAAPPTSATPVAASTAGLKPDIYLIVLDEYARGDTLDVLYQYDNSPFIDALRARGFTVAEDSRANYAETQLSIGSQLNMQYLDALAKQEGPQSRNYRALKPYLEHNKVVVFLRQQGYRIANLCESRIIYFAKPDVYYNLAQLKGGLEADPLPEFGTALYDLTPAKPFLVAVQRLRGQLPNTFYEPPQYTIMRGTHRRFFELMPTLAEIPGPKFVYAHLLAAHYPLVFDSKGNPVSKYLYWDLFANAEQREQFLESYEPLYTGQITYMNARLLRMIDTLIAKSTRPSVFIIESDHGPLPNHQPVTRDDQAGAYERMGNFNAIRFYGAPSPEFTPHTSLVNTFPIIFNRYFDTRIPLLPNRSYYSLFDTPFDFIDVTDAMDKQWEWMQPNTPSLEGKPPGEPKG